MKQNSFRLSGVLAVESSGNSKTGKISATYVSQKSCPLSCPFRNAGCYAETGPCGMVTRTLDVNISALTIAQNESLAIGNLSGVRDLRVHVVGDCSTVKAASIVGSAMAYHTSKYGRSAYTYTHAWRSVSRSAWGSGIAVSASLEDTRDIDRARDQGYAKIALVIAHIDSVRPKNAIICPAQLRGVSCLDCRICLNEKRIQSCVLRHTVVQNNGRSTYYKKGRNNAPRNLC